MPKRIHLANSYDPLYETLKGKAYHLAETVTGHTHITAHAKGFEDLWAMIMADSDHIRQYNFLAHLPRELSDKQRPILLDGLARQYQNCKGWMDYVDRENP